jgi:hypothetical protein
MKDDPPFGQNIHSPVGIVPDLPDNLGGAAETRHQLGCRQNHAKFQSFFKAAPNHQPVPRFEYVEGEFGARHQHDIERKQGNAAWSLH